MTMRWVGYDRMLKWKLDSRLRQLELDKKAGECQFVASSKETRRLLRGEAGGGGDTGGE
jgi:hypothetical protein